MKILFSTNLPSPYRVDFFNELGKFCELTVCYERRSAADRDDKWKGEKAKNFKEIYLDLIPVGADRSRGADLKNLVKEASYDLLVFTNYVSPAVRKAIFYCQRRKIPYCMEYDGGFNKKDNFVKRQIKKWLLVKAERHLTTCEEHRDYLQSLGIKAEKIFKYPFTSLKAEDIEREVPTATEKQDMRIKLGITEEKVLLSVGQFIHRKGFDVLLKGAASLPKNVGVYIVGGKPTEEYLQYQKEYALINVHFAEFMPKALLKQWYKAADCFVLPTREDVWGLVVNEAMACGLPVVTTEKCIAGLELIKEGENGYILPVENAQALTQSLTEILEGDGKRAEMAKNSLLAIRAYTIENMAKRHMEIFE